MPRGSNIQSLIERFQHSFDEANAANRRRARRIERILDRSLENVQERFGESMDLLENLGDSDRARVRERFAEQGAIDEQDLISRGLSSSTVLTSMRRERDRDEARLNLDITENVARQRAGLLTQQAQLEAGIMDRMASFLEAQTDQGFDPNLMASLLGQAASDPGGGRIPLTVNRPGGSLWQESQQRRQGGGGARAPRKIGSNTIDLRNIGASPFGGSPGAGAGGGGGGGGGPFGGGNVAAMAGPGAAAGGMPGYGQGLGVLANAGADVGPSYGQGLGVMDPNAQGGGAGGGNPLEDRLRMLEEEWENAEGARRLALGSEIVGIRDQLGMG